ncbi:hypothetical protein AGMMS50268_22690 [Spirochaetia bacterium]|nr:hypothetical protein AGMMS50268_22690 [Spirochaetia bacterium]
MSMRTCPECGRTFDVSHASRIHTGYCSDKCARAAQAAKEAQSAKVAAKYGGSSGGNSRGIAIGIVGIGILIIIGLIGLAVNGIRNAFSDVKTEIVSASCETEEKFVSILNKALSEVSVTVIEGEEFTTYSGQAIDAVKKREGEYGLFKDSVYFVRLPDSVNVYVWFKTKDDVTAYVYKKE